ncbi:hypothetical protein JH06_3852 [Blastocystis sp. subtype 4]|uniref:hypothetical protein n=1 Tax=Blastocystis sp. subtype 4 TaxID=944170 RepID=UPI000711E2DE|nr:hypothetical protein JH06_3852 [Blastocystis sp. subtype 4]KNB42933.1 hypothetical protein JH06_3852 [Blastocystis sp. subtype 4]|eukprot:XP_014526376.1 hypothetical protein JH06_3852 [Blastocystis sp. subtype 4]
MEHLNRVKKNEAIKRENKGEKVCLKRIPAQPRACHTVVPTKPIKTVYERLLLNWCLHLFVNIFLFFGVMVFFYTIRGTFSSGYKCFMGKDKYENEDLIAYGWPEDVWCVIKVVYLINRFHVDEVSSAHAISESLMVKGETIDDIPEETLEDVFQLVKNHSISGVKMPKVYTMWSNLRKGQDMDTGTIGFHNTKDVHKKIGVSRDRMIVNRIEKTKVEAQPDFQKEREIRDAEELREKKKALKEQRIREKQETEANKKKKAEQSYECDRIFEHTELMDYNDFMTKSSDVSSARAYEDDFM